MSVRYLPIKTSSVASRGSMLNRIVHQIDLKPVDTSLFAEHDDNLDHPGQVNFEDILDPTPEGATVNINTAMSEGTNYSPDRHFIATPAGKGPQDDITEPVHELEKDSNDQPIIHPDGTGIPDDIIVNTDDDQQLVPSAVVDYYSETSANYDNIIYGIPRLSQFPLMERADVIYAIDHLDHVKDPRDRAVLVENIMKVASSFDITVKFDAFVNEAAIPGSIPFTQVQTALGLGEKKKDRDMIIKDHIDYNSQFYNAVYYSKDYATVVKQAENFPFMEYFYPNMITHNFNTRLMSCLGGLGLDMTTYSNLGMKAPMSTDDKQPIGWWKKPDSEEKLVDIEMLINTTYDTYVNWFKADTGDNLDHVIYCLRLYSILGHMLHCSTFTMDDLTPEQNAVLADWEQHIHYHYDKYKELEPHSTKWYNELQYLHDLFWNFHDDPYADESKAECICAFASELAGGSSNLTPKHSVYSKADCTKYLIKELNLPEDIFLLPIVMEYPILDRGSIKFAIDSIQQVEQTYPDMVKEYVTNLNRKYKEFGCTYQISGNHPYAKYAIPEMVDKVTNLLSEGDTVVSDTDGASEIGSPNNKTDQPWYKRLDYTGTLYRDGSENKEMGPNTKPMQKPDWAQHYSIL